ncbi:ABC transporter ATP-binding protein [Paraflavitalea sp. CAU 1676]|uniref:ABC transporter ATP-binding protein n=1 Tax=Paraflavitalea sp. CAU 1676 TaxID=3032598 RepID=UPI0023DB586C|nr:ABC transporter ATP-binding protein [Paraflavitalea sp. CAU 1676]MDF2188335.1 ABC transporter ATP-binding protein [Paraflavitalea sp. CAU 1676]
MEQPIIELAGLTKCYGSLKAVDQLDLQIRPGEIYGLLGPNGAGKTTTILMMLGLTEPSAGVAKVCGINATHHPIAVKRKVGYMPDNVGFYDSMTAFDNLQYIARLSGLPEREVKNRTRDMMELVGLGDALHKKAGAYSRGMKQRLGLADVLIRQPEVIILDEPTLGIDPSGVKDFLGLIRQLSRQQGITVLLSSHHLHQVQQVCDRVGIFVGGKLLADGNVETLSRHLFSGDQFVISITLANALPDTLQVLTALKAMEGIKDVSAEGRTIEITSARNITPDIVRFFVAKELDIMGVHKKEYGLEDIYQRYFENNLTDHEKDGKSSGLFQRSFFRKVKK